MVTEGLNEADSEYVRQHLEPVLTELLVELYLVKPSDPGITEVIGRFQFKITYRRANIARI